MIASMRRTPAAMLLSDDDLEEADIAGAADVGAAAEFLAEIGNHDHANIGSVFLAEERHRAGGDGLIERHDVGGHFGVAKNLFVDEALDFGDFGGIDRGVVAEIETQARGFDYAAGLFDVRSEDLAERGVEEVRRGVVALGGEAFAYGYFGAEFVSCGNLRERMNPVHGEAGDRGVRIENGRHLLAVWRRSRELP